MTKISCLSNLPFEERTNPFTGPYIVKVPYNIVDEDLDTVIQTIREERFKKRINKMRACYDTDKASYDYLKHKLPVILFTGIYKHYGNDGLLVPSNLAIIDFDKIPLQELAAVSRMLEKDPYTYVKFLSPSGRGYKVVVKVEDNRDNQSNTGYLDALKGHYANPYWDNNNKGICRACFFSSDKHIYVNPDSRVWTENSLKANASQALCHGLRSTLASTPQHFANASQVETIIRYLEGGWAKFPMTPGNRHDSTFKRAREMAEWGIPEDAALGYLSRYSAPDFPQSELQRQVDNAYGWVRDKGNTGSKYRKL